MHVLPNKSPTLDSFVEEKGKKKNTKQDSMVRPEGRGRT